MGFIRRVFLVIITPLLPVLLFATALDFGILHVAGSPTPIKHILADSGLYKNVISSALDQAQQSSGTNNSVTLTDSAIKSAAQASFTPQVVQQSTEQAIDGIYDWLNGKSAQPDFNIDLTSVKNSFAQNVGQAAQQRASTLPVCGSLPATSDPLNATCLPPGVTPTQIGEQAKADVLNAQGFLEHPAITADSIKKSGSNQSVFASGNLQNAPKQFQRAKKSPFVLVLLTLLVSAAIIFLSASRRKGFRRVGITLMVTGVTLLLFAWGLNKVANQKLIPKMQFDNKVLQTDVQKLASDLVQNFDKNYQTFGEIYTAIGVLAIAGALFIGRGSKKAASAKQNSAASNSSPVPGNAPSQQSANNAPPKPKRTPPKIQG